MQSFCYCFSYIWGEIQSYCCCKVAICYVDHTNIHLFAVDVEQCQQCIWRAVIDPCLLCQGAVSAGGDVSVHGFAARPSRSVEPAGTQPVCSGHHGRGMGKGNSYNYCTVDQCSTATKAKVYSIMSLLLKTEASACRD